jgi:hypothetical protein
MQKSQGKKFVLARGAALLIARPVVDTEPLAKRAYYTVVHVFVAAYVFPCR